MDPELTRVAGDRFYIKSMLLNGQPVADRHIMLKPGESAKMEIVVSNNGGEVDAVVTPSTPAPEEPYPADLCSRTDPVQYFFLIPDTRSGAESSAFVLPANCFQCSAVRTGGMTTGGYAQITGIPPGRYYAVGAENFSSHSDSWTRNWDFLQSLKALSTPVEVVAGQKIKLSLQSPTAAIQNLMARYQEAIAIEDHCGGSCSYEAFWNGDGGHQQK